MKRKSVFIMAAALLLTAFVTPMSGSVSAGEGSDVELAQQAAQGYVNHVAGNVPDPSKWQGSVPTSPQPYFNLAGEINAYMFAIKRGNEVLGHVLVGDAEYGFDVFQAADSAPPAIPDAAKVQTALENSLGVMVDTADVGNPIRLLYLGVDGQYALYDVRGDSIGVNLVHGDALRASEMRDWLPTPAEYRDRQAQTGSLRPAATYVTDGVRATSNFLTIGYYVNGNRNWCGPCSGVSIGHYYKYYSATGTTYSNLYGDDAMYDSLYSNMQAAPWVIPYNYGPGFVYMTNECCYNNFRGDWYPFVGSSHYFNRIVPDIDSGWPHGLCVYPYINHWRAIKGYDYSSGTHYIWCTNHAIPSSWEQLNWDALPDSQHDTVRIRDNG
jgi:hypothetical protein